MQANLSLSPSSGVSEPPLQRANTPHASPTHAHSYFNKSFTPLLTCYWAKKQQQLIIIISFHQATGILLPCLFGMGQHSSGPIWAFNKPRRYICFIFISSQSRKQHWWCYSTLPSRKIPPANQCPAQRHTTVNWAALTQMSWEVNANASSPSQSVWPQTSRITSCYSKCLII